MPILRWLARRRAYNQLVEQEATTLAEQKGGAGYYTARQIARLASERGDISTAKLWWKVSRRIATITGIEPGRSKIGRTDAER